MYNVIHFCFRVQSGKIMRTYYLILMLHEGELIAGKITVFIAAKVAPHLSGAHKHAAHFHDSCFSSNYHRVVSDLPS